MSKELGGRFQNKRLFLDLSLLRQMFETEELTFVLFGCMRSPVMERILSPVFFQHFPWLVSLTLLAASTVAFAWSLLKTWQGMINVANHEIAI